MIDHRAFAMALCLCVAAPVAAQCPDGTPPPCGAVRKSGAALRAVPAPSARARLFMLLPFRNVTRAPAQDWLVVGAPLMLGEALGSYREITVVPDERLTAARRRLAYPADSTPDARQLRRLADETDGWTAVTGSLISAGGRLRVSAQALDVATAKVLVRAETEVAADADVRDAFNRLSVKLLEVAGVEPAAPDMAALPTRSLDAYRAYAQGIAFMHQSAFRRAQAAFAEAVRLDSTFALASMKLAIAALASNPQVLIDPTNPAVRATEQAVRQASRLPARQAQLARSLQSFFRGQTTRARAVADSLVRTDESDLDAKELLSFMEMLDPVMDTTAATPRLKASRNQAVLMALEVLERDPGRRYLYSVPAFIYGIGAGLWMERFPGVRREAGSLAAMYGGRIPMDFVPVIRGDSIESVPDPDWRALPASEQERLKARDASAAMEWVQRWLVAGPGDAEAHLWASRIAEVQGAHGLALREAVTADSIGVESWFEQMSGRRLMLLVRVGRYTDAAALADSLLADGKFAKRPLIPVIDRVRTYGVFALLLARRWDSAAALGVAMGPGGPNSAPCSTLQQWAGNVAATRTTIAESRAVMDTVAMHFGELAARPTLVRCAESLASALMRDSSTVDRPVAGAALLRAADSLHQAGNDASAYRAARAARIASESQRPAIEGRAWFVERSRDLAIGRHFAAGAAVVEGDSAVFSFKRTTTGPIVIDSPGLATNWDVGVYVRVEAGPDTANFYAWVARNMRPTESGLAGGVPELLASATSNYSEFSGRREAVSGAPSVLVPTSDGFRLVQRGLFVAELRRLKPAMVRFESSPCIAVTEGLCAKVTVPITYR